MDIQKALADPVGAFAKPAKAMESPKKLQNIFPWIAALIMVGIVVGLVLLQQRAPEPQIIPYDYDLPDCQELTWFEELKQRVPMK
ncbi:MAG: hypothetical protein JXR49_21870 [Acidobacteria bacterium]|nr:hypothetical protein [Acidobacteriota bacterium]